MLNHIVLMGRLTRDPELRRTGSGKPVASFTLACNRDFKNPQTGESEADFVDCVAWNGTAEMVSKYFTKGRMAVVSGRLQVRNWTDNDGAKRRNVEILVENVYFGDSKPNNGAGQTQPTGQHADWKPRHDYRSFVDPEANAGVDPMSLDMPEFPIMSDEDGELPF